MKLVDTNVLVYAVDETSPQHPQSKAWMEDSLSGTETVAFAWVALVGFIRVSTLRRAVADPLSVVAATTQVDEWLAAPPAQVIHPGRRHASLLADLLGAVGTGGNLVNDAHLAALSLEHRAEVVSFDTDFARFPRRAVGSSAAGGRSG